MFISTLKPYFTGHEYKEVMTRIKPTSFLGFIFVFLLRLVLAPLELLIMSLTPYSQRVESFRASLTTAFPQYKSELNDWAEAVIKIENGEEDST